MVGSFQLEATSGARLAAAQKVALPVPKLAVKKARNGHAPAVNPEDVTPMEREASFKEF